MATIFQSLRRWFGNVGSTGQQDGIQYSEPFQRVYDTRTVYGTDGALQVSAVWACIELLADNIASLPCFVYERMDGPMGHKELARDTQLWTLLHDNPNRYQTPMEFWQYMIMNFLLRGNAYARLVRGTNNEVIEMLPMSADQIEVELLRDGSIIYKYQFEGQITILSSESVLHWKDKGNGVIGMSRIDFMASTISVAIEAQNHTERSYRKSGKRPGVFMIDKLLTDPQRDEIRKRFSGLVENNEDDLLVLEAGAKFEPLSMTPADLQLLDTRRFSVEDIARWFGVSSVMINDTNKTTTWGTGISQLIEGFYKFRLRPMLELFEQAINRRVLTARQRELYEVEFSLDAILRGNAKERLEIGVQAVTNGLMTRNEWRQLENLPRMDGADELTYQMNMAPTGSLDEPDDDDDDDLPVVAATPSPTGDAAAEGTSIQATALNGAQVTSLVEIINMVGAGQMPEGTARGVIAAAFPLLTEQQISDMLAPMIGFEPRAAAAPAPFGE
jgi:HK97 family phage portal protein